MLKELSSLLKNISILYVEDEKETREQMTQVLAQLSNNIFVASCASSAIQIYEQNKPQIIISDIAMPEIDGIEFIKNVRQTDLQTPIILLTAYNEVEYLLPAANLNIQSYIIKPITKSKLKEVLLDALKLLNLNTSLYIKITSNIKYDKNNSELIYEDNRSNKLNKKEKKLMDLLLKNQNRVVSYSEIERTVWMDYDEVMTSMALRTIIKNLRKKTLPELIKNVSGHGYKILID